MTRPWCLFTIALLAYSASLRSSPWSTLDQKFERVHLHSLADAKKRNQNNWPAVPDIIERAVGQPRPSFLHIDSFCPRTSSDKRSFGTECIRPVRSGRSSENKKKNK